MKSRMSVLAILAASMLGCTTTFTRLTPTSAATSTSGPGGSTTMIDERNQMYAPGSPLHKCIELEMMSTPVAPDNPRYADDLNVAKLKCKMELGIGVGWGANGALLMNNPGSGAVQAQAAQAESSVVMDGGLAGVQADIKAQHMTIMHLKCRLDGVCPPAKKTK